MTTTNGHHSAKLPIILVAGMLGAGKTTVLHHFVNEYEGGPLALAHLEATDFLFDTGIMRGLSLTLGRDENAVAGIQVDNPKTPWKETLTRQIGQWEKTHEYDAALVEVSNFLPVAEVIAALKPIEKKCEIRNVVYVADALELWLILSEYSSSEPGSKEKLLALEKTIKENAAAATTLILHKTDVLTPPRLELCRKYLKRILPQGQWREASFGAVPVEEIIATHPSKKAGKAEEKAKIPEKEMAFVFRARRPFHPQRLWDEFFEKQPQLLRAKGFIWLATRMEAVGGLSQAGASYSIGVAGKWWASFPSDQWPKEGEARERVMINWKEPYGDRRQELLLIAPEETHAPLRAALQNALLTDSEMEVGPVGWREFQDPFGDWEKEIEDSGATFVPEE